MNFSLDGKVALVTGGSKGIGRAIAQSLAEEGARVIITARGETALQEAMQELSRFKILAIKADATNESEVNEVVKYVIDSHGKLDILINNIGGVSKSGSFSDLSNSDWVNAFDLNVMSIVNFVRASESYLRRSTSGRIIIISSISAVQPGVFNPHYTISKASTVNLGKFLANYFVNDNVLVNTVCPGPVHSDSWDVNVRRLALDRRQSFEDAWEQVESEESQKIPLGRVGNGDDIAPLVSFLASEKASWITGSCFHINGGKLKSV